jgi:hypothetical protein
VLLLSEISEIPPLQEKVPRRKIIVYKSRVDLTVVKLTAEKMKNKLFIKFGFSKPKPEDIRIVSVDKTYEPYVLIDGKYQIHYYKKRFYTLEVSDETEEVKILGQAFQPESVVSPPEQPRKAVKLEVEERFSYEDKSYMLLDKSGCEVSPDRVPSAPSEDHPEKILKESGEKLGKIKTTPKKEVEMIKSRIVKRPSDADRIENELFEISEHAVIYSPIYEITFSNIKTGEDRIMKVDGITAKIIA